MANPEHVAVVRQGAAAIRQWREAHPDFPFDLTNADLTGATLSDTDLWGADLTGADLTNADLRRATLREASLTEASLTEASLTGVNLVQAILSFASVRGAILTNADLTSAYLTNANLTNANLTGATLTGADLWGADLTRAVLYDTVLAKCDLSTCRGLDTVQHEGPSPVATDTLAATFRGAGNMLAAELYAFFLGAGVPKELLALLPRIMAEVPYDSCFLSYGEPDRALAERLYHDLQACGVTCWLYASDATPGRRTQSEVKARLREADRTVVLCSADALIREGVLIELEERIDDDPERLIPISLDNIWKHPGFRVMRGTRDLGPWLRERNYADFDKLGYDEGLRRLLKALERPAAPAAPA